MKIRVMVIQDYDDVHRLWMNTPGMGLNHFDDSRAGIEKYLSRNPKTCFVAVREGGIVGAVIAGHDGRRGYLYHAAVAVSERGQGIGSALLDATLTALEQEGVSKASLVVFSNNEIGNRFWEKHGFSSRGDLVYRNKEIKPSVRIDT